MTKQDEIEALKARTKRGDNVLLRNRLGNLDNYVVMKRDEVGVELGYEGATVRYNFPIWATTWHGFHRATNAI